jgi:hypothetical protein
VDQTDLNNYITAANTAIGPFDLEIRNTLHQTTRTRIYSLVNTTSDPLTQLATTYTADEIAYLKRVLDTMFEANNTRRSEVMAITSFQALALAKVDGRRETQNGNTQAARQDLTMLQAEKTLKSLVDEGWFEKSAKNFYSLSPRALMELKSWLVDTYNDDGDDGDEEDQRVRIKTCQACREIITVVSLLSLLSLVEDAKLKEAGSTMSAAGVPVQTPRHLHAGLLPSAAIDSMSAVPDRMDRQGLRGREGHHDERQVPGWSEERR